jgi:hypothetical protein
MVKCLIALTSLFSAAALAVPVWTWVDESGQRHYSDRPVEGATQIEIGTSQTFSGEAPQPNSGTTSSPASQESDSDTGPPYTVLDVISPEPEQTLSNIGGEMTLELAVSPALRAPHSIGVIYDGQRLEPSSRSLSITITEVYRGEHTIQAVILDADGEELMRSTPVTFFVRQTSIQN